MCTLRCARCRQLAGGGERRYVDGMHSMADDAVAGLAASQHGVFTRRQAAAVGFTRRAVDHRIATGRWWVVAPGVLAVPGAPTSWYMRL